MKLTIEGKEYTAKYKNNELIIKLKTDEEKWVFINWEKLRKNHSAIEYKKVIPYSNIKETGYLDGCFVELNANLDKAFVYYDNSVKTADCKQNTSNPQSSQMSNEVLLSTLINLFEDEIKKNIDKKFAYILNKSGTQNHIEIEGLTQELNCIEAEIWGIKRCLSEVRGLYKKVCPNTQTK